MVGNKSGGIIVGDLVNWYMKEYGASVVGLVLGVKPNTFYPEVDTYSILDLDGLKREIHSSVWPDYRILNR
jgi:hypothetical protein